MPNIALLQQMQQQTQQKLEGNIMDKKQFWAVIVPTNIKNQINTAAILAFITAAMTVVLAIMLSPLYFIDAILVLGLGLGILFAKSRVCATILLVYFVLSKILMISGMNAGSIVVAIAFIIGYGMGVYGTFSYHKLRKETLLNAELHQ